MRSWLGEGVGFRIAFLVAFDIRPVYFHSIVAVVAVIACYGPLLVSRLVNTVPLRWVPLSFRVPFCVPFAENVGCWVAEILPAVGIMSIAGGWSAVLAIAVLGTLGVPDIAAGGPLVIHSYYCSGAVPLSDVLASARGVVVASALR